MAEIFLSYANEDRATALRLSQLLESAGWSVWWDRRIPAGRTWRAVLEEALVEMRCMVVLWSNHSIHSDWVKEEAEEARELGKLVPVLIEAVKPPVGFRAIQAADIAGWDGSSDFPGAQQLIADLKALIGTPAEKQNAQAPVAPTVQNESGVEHIEHAAESATSHAANEQRGSDREHRFDQKRIFAISGTLALVLLLGASLVWLKTRHNDSDQPVTAASEPYPNVKEPAEPELVSLSIENGQTKLNPKQSFTARVRGRYSDGNEKQLDSGIQWSSSNPKIAAIDANGTVTALEPGQTEITGRYNNVTTSPLNLNVAPVAVTKADPTLVALRIQRTRKELTANETIPLRVRGNYSDGSEKPVGSKIEWETSDPRVAAVTSNGELRALQAGETNVIATVGGIKSTPLHFVVRGRVPQQVETEASAQKAYATPAVNPAVRERPVVNVAPYLNRAKDYRVQGNYTAALAELEKARTLDDANTEVRQEIDQTRRACNAEKRLGRYDLQC